MESPERECAGEEATSGRGLLLVEALADAWGWYPVEVGKVVWFEYPETRETPCPTQGWGTALDLRTADQAKKASRICWAASPAGRVPARTWVSNSGANLSTSLFSWRRA